MESTYPMNDKRYGIDEILEHEVKILAYLHGFDRDLVMKEFKETAKLICSMLPNQEDWLASDFIVKAMVISMIKARFIAPGNLNFYSIPYSLLDYVEKYSNEP